MCFLYVTVVGDLGVGRRRKCMVAVGLELQEQGWYVLVGQGVGLTEHEGVAVNSFLMCYTIFFIYSEKSNKD